MIRVYSIIGAFLLIASAASAQPTPPAARSADEIARRATNIIGAADAFEKARYIAFTFSVERDGKVVSSFPQKWDRFTGEYRVSGKTADGISFEVTLNVNTKMGHGTLNGRPIHDPAQFKELFEIGYRHFINDTNFLLMPFKILYPGVHHVYDGERSDSCGHSWDLLKLTFDDVVGLPHGDTYWMWVDRDSGMIEEWDIKTRGAAANAAPIEVTMRGYQRVAGLLLSTRREVRANAQTIRFDDLEVSSTVPKGAFP